MYNLGISFLKLMCFSHKPVTKPYTASSIIIWGKIIAGGIPVVILERNGVIIPHAKP